eukprot:COSAG06_NODE_14_length_35011_cov_20.984132_22_plen_48_part_00
METRVETTSDCAREGRKMELMPARRASWGRFGGGYLNSVATRREPAD